MGPIDTEVTITEDGQLMANVASAKVPPGHYQSLIVLDPKPIIDIETILQQLAKERPVFHSEADFQHAFAWELRRNDPAGKIRLEYKHPDVEEPGYTDIWYEGQEQQIAIELKYCTKKAQLKTSTSEEFNLLNHGAQDLRRYDFFKDIMRVEEIVSSSKNGKPVGYAIMLTNDTQYWKEQMKGRITIDYAFRIHEDRQIEIDNHLWSTKAGTGTTRTRTQPIVIKNAYTLKWKDYPANENFGFKYLLVEVKSTANP